MTGTGAGVSAAVRRGSRRLLLVRHAKADYPEGVADHERPLAERGERDARALGSWLAEERFVPDVVVVSTAVRARRTWELAAEVLGEAAAEVHLERRVYEADADTLLAVLREVGGDAHTVALVGHEPGVSTLAKALADEATSDPEELAGLGDSVPTAGVVILRGRGVWRDTPVGGLVLSRVVVPRG